MVTLFTKNNCPNCKKVKRLLKVSGISYKEINVETDDNAFDFVKNQLGFSSLPVFELDKGEKTYHTNYSEILEKVKELRD